MEHLPPRSADNAEPVHLLDDAGNRIKEFVDGHALPVLCEADNKAASDRRLTSAYKLWRLEVIDAIEQHTLRHSHGRAYNIWRTDSVVEIDHGYNIHPGRIARQVLGMLLAVQDSPDLSRNNRALRHAYFSDEGASIAPWQIHVALANPGFAYWTDAIANVHLNLRTAAATATTLRVLCFAPFLAVLVEDGAAPPFPAFRIDGWLEHPLRYHFRKADRHVAYPVARRSNPMVARLYGLNSRV